MKNILVTGASTGIGKAAAHMLAKRGFRVFAGVRRETDGGALRVLHENIIPVMCDVTSSDCLSQLLAVIKKETSGILDGLVNNAGIAEGGPVELSTVADLEKVFATNVTGPFRLVQMMLPLLRAAKGRIVNISSIAGLISLPGVGVYAASKHALEALSDAWRVELHNQGIKVILIEPGNVETPIWEKAKKSVAQKQAALTADEHERYHDVMASGQKILNNPNGVPVERVAKKICAALEKKCPRSRYLVGPDAYGLNLLNFLPTCLRDFLVRFGMKMKAG